MSISCGCGGDYDWFYIPSDWFAPLDKKRARRCISCQKKIKIGEDCLKLNRYRTPNCDYEEKRFGDEVPLADKYYCEECGEIFLNLTAYGYCVYVGEENIREDLRAHWDATGFSPEKEDAA